MDLDVVMPIGPGEQPYCEPALGSILMAESVGKVILVLDGRESLPEMSVETSDPRIIVCVNSGRRGIGSAMNFGVAQSNAEYIAIMHADDVSHPFRFNEQLRAMNENPGCVVMGTLATEPEDLTDPREGIDAAVGVVIVSPRDIVSHMPLTNPTTVFRRSAFYGVHGYKDSMTSMEDYELLLRLATMGQVCILPVVLHGYRSHPDQQSRKHRAFREWWWIFVARLGVARSGQVTYAEAVAAQVRWMAIHLKLSLTYRTKVALKRN
jgi:GT2 family glycosyltransferase